MIFLYEKLQKSTARSILAAFFALCLSLSCLTPAYAGERTLIPLGKVVGIKLYADGALVVGVTDSPAGDSGLRPGDVLLRLNETKIDSTEQLQAYLQENGPKPLTLTYSRDGRTRTCVVTPEPGEDGVYRIGAWIRDSMAGIGTLTYYDPATGRYGALGHGITDTDTQALLTLSRGSIMATTVKAVKKGAKGDPGELKGDFSQQRDIGTLTANTGSGVFGATSDASYFAGEPMTVADPEEVVVGRATILSTVSGSDTESYEVEIVRLYRSGDATRNMLLRITDKRLLEATGGIVQGMSGSPIIQNGQLIGAVTHVLVNDPSQGYGIFIDNMLKMAG